MKKLLRMFGKRNVEIEPNPRCKSLDCSVTQSTFSSELRWNISPEVRITYNKDGAVVLDIEQGICFSLNAVGSKVFEYLESNPHSSLDQVLHFLEGQFDTPRERIQQDLVAYMQDLYDRGLLKSSQVVSF